MGLLQVLTDYNNARSLAFRLRLARAEILKKTIERIFTREGRCRIIDLGGSELYWKIIDPEFLLRRNCRITLLNLSDIELTEGAAGADAQGIFTRAIGNACRTTLGDGAFDLVHSNSTIEHVGDWTQMRAFAAEVRRLAPAYFVQTPSFWFPIEPHFGAPFWHWLPEPVRVALLLRRGWGYFARAGSASEAVATVQSCRLLDRRMVTALFPDAQIVREKFAGLTKSLIAIRPPPDQPDARSAEPFPDRAFGSDIRLQAQ